MSMVTIILKEVVFRLATYIVFYRHVQVFEPNATQVMHTPMAHALHIVGGSVGCGCWVPRTAHAADRGRCRKALTTTARWCGQWGTKGVSKDETRKVKS